MDVSIVIPTYNEKENITPLVEKIINVCHLNKIEFEIIIVDDNSPDGTGEIADQLAKKYKNIIVIHRERKLGLGSAYKTGFKKASSEIVVETDADLSHDPNNIPKFIELIRKGADVVIGSRYVEGGTIVGWPYQRRLISKSANALANFILGMDVKDVTSGYRAYMRRALNKIGIEAVKSEGYAFQLEMVYLARKRKLQIIETPITFVDRKIGTSKLSRNEILKFFLTVIKLKLR